MKYRTWFLIFLLVLCFGMKGLEAKKIIINGNEEEKTLQCAGDEVVVSGNGNTNEVHVATVGTITANGSFNKIFWQKGIDEEKSAISNVGTGNKISREEE